MLAKSSTCTCPPSVAALPRIASFSMAQSWATCAYAMSRLRLPIRVRPPPSTVPRWTVTNSRMMFRSPMTTRVGCPAYLRCCGARPIDTNGAISLSSPISVQPSITVDAPIRHRLPIVTCGPIDACCAIVVPSPITAPGLTTADGSTNARSGSTAMRRSASATTCSPT